MSQRNIEKMAADGLWEQWRADIERIRGEVHELFSDGERSVMCVKCLLPVHGFKRSEAISGSGFVSTSLGR